ncbi:unnamed protein product [Brachionus calyciflorus]|uniref:Ferritin n=1 Tax=Brachionus calyciflorus TaxID=104777 RepID=A0A813MXV6_9BILA|nr:unnamed protein product [Brachionus calyciflorus]
MGNYTASYTRTDNGLIRHNFTTDSEEYLNNLINVLFTGCYNCEAMAYYFDRSDIGLYGMADFCRYGSFYVTRINKKVMDYVVERGGRICLATITKPEWVSNTTPLKYLETLCVKLKELYNFGQKIHENADIKNDPNLTDFLETELIEPLALMIREIEVLWSNLSLAGSGLGEFEFNKDLERYINQFMDEKLELLEETDLEEIWL